MRDSLAAIVQAQLTAWESAGSPPTFSVDGESYNWDSWLSTKLDALEKLDKQIARHSSGIVRSRYRG